MLGIIAGRREQGKTTLAYNLACRFGRRAIYDPRGEFATSPAHDFLLPEDADKPEVIVQPELDAAIEFSPFCDVVKLWLTDVAPDTRRAIIVDEARFVDFGALSFDYIIRCVRRDHALVIITAHRPSDVPVDVRAIADFWCVFQTTQEHDQKVLTERCGSEFAEKVKRLGAFQFLHWDDARGVMTEYRDPRSWYVPIRPAHTATA